MVIVPDAPREKLCAGAHALCSLSKAVCSAGVKLSSLKPFEHLLSAYGGDEYSIRLPTPLISLIQSGKAAPGKNNCVKEFLIVSRPDMPLEEAVSRASAMQESLIKTLLIKTGVGIKNVSDTGSVCPLLDKPEQALEMIAEAATQNGLEMGKDFSIVLNASAQECFDYEKGKYEVMTGVLKAPEDMAEFWQDLVTRYPVIIGLIDPVRPEERAAWNRICELVSSRCLIITDRGYSRPALLAKQELDFFDFATSGFTARLEGAASISDIVAVSKKMADADNVMVMACGQHETEDGCVVEAAIAARARFLKIGALSRGERISKYNKLIGYERELGERLAFWPELTFPNIPPRLPTPDPTPPPNEDPTPN